ncbi:hypothetical protein [Streptomyces sp. NPDC002265]|uniref:hypothetical protein n=1 Tax=Streptomyces sp. NPDC002265 TaxID=3154415 RepID=UPI0033279551
MSSRSSCSADSSIRSAFLSIASSNSVTAPIGSPTNSCHSIDSPATCTATNAATRHR